jgi:EAL domain-containing protein (putative c-di-GMP-specific phosphodiesterase class I)
VCDLLCNPKPGIILALLRNMRSDDDVEHIRDRIVRIGQRPFSFLGKTFLSGLSVGGAIVRKEGGDADYLIRRIASDMHRPHNAPQDGFELAGFEVESYVRYALRENLFNLRFQRQYTRGGELRGVGVQMQMRIPEAVWLAEENFLPWVEDQQLILKMSKQALRSACLQAGEWHRRGVVVSSFSIAIPTAHFLQKDFVQTLLSLLKEAGIPGSFLELGLTGATIRANFEATGSVLGALSARGVRFYVRGSSVTSLPTSYLRSLPIKTLEVSCSESAPALTDSVNVLRAVVSHGCRLGLIVRATDVQSTSQRLALFEAGCDSLQGPLVSRPLSAEELETASFLPGQLHESHSIRRGTAPRRKFPI